MLTLTCLIGSVLSVVAQPLQTRVIDEGGTGTFIQTSVDFYSLTPAQGLRWLSPHLPKAKYTLEVKVSEMKPN